MLYNIYSRLLIIIKKINKFVPIIQKIGCEKIFFRKSLNLFCREESPFCDLRSIRIKWPVINQAIDINQFMLARRFPYISI